MSELSGQNILLGVSGGIAAYKTPMLVRGLTAAGANVQVVMTANASRFVTPTTLQAVSGRPVRSDLWDAEAEAAMGHIELARWADQILIAPATANVIADLARGSAPDLLSTLCLATAAPISIAPAMNQHMFQHPAVGENLRRLADLGYCLIGPEYGDQACGDHGPGRMTEPEDLIRAMADTQLEPQRAGSVGLAGLLTGQHLMITTGPTREAIDPVRYISNHSSGLQGLALAEAALDAGASVTLVAGPGVPACHPDIKRLDVTTAQDMYAAVHQHLEHVSLFIGVAAVADYRPQDVPAQKMKRGDQAAQNLTLSLVENPDIIASVAQCGRVPVVVGFAAETEMTLENASLKLTRKKLDAVIVNDVSDSTIGFNSDHNAVTLVHHNGQLPFEKQSKQAISRHLITALTTLFKDKLNLEQP